MRVIVQEGDAHRVRAGAGLSTADCLNTETRWTSRNFFGGARRLQLRGRLSNLFAPVFEDSLCKDAGVEEYGDVNWLVSADFTQPWLFTPRFSLAASLYLERHSVKNVFVRTARGMNLALVRSLGQATALTFSYRPQRSSLEAAEVFFCSSFLVCDPGDIELLQSANWISPIGVSLSRSRVNDALNPTVGYSFFVDYEYAAEWTHSDYQYKRLIGETSWYRELSTGLVVAARVRAGWLNPGPFRGLESDDGDANVVHPQTRLYAGGSNSVRGFAQNRLGPVVLTVKPQTLIGEMGQLGPCDQGQVLMEIPDGPVPPVMCDAIDDLPDEAFAPRPTGGTRHLEGSFELRFPLVGPTVEGAAFVDVGNVWPEDLRIDLGTLEVTPGFGIRYFTPIGPIRIDIAYRFADPLGRQVYTLEVKEWTGEEGDPCNACLTDPADPEGKRTIPWVMGERLRPVIPDYLWGDHSSWSLRRFQFHLSIGQAF